MNSNRDNIDQLKNIILDKLKPLINSDFVLLDVPNHRNIGDSLIWSGEVSFFKNLSNKLLAQYNRYTFKNSFVADFEQVILLHGGGNFGDIYASSQEFRKEVVANFNRNRIIVLPQTIFYKNKENLKRDFEVFRKHKELFICVRDKVSLALVKPYFPADRLLLVPDMAFCLDYDSFININPTNKTLFFKRTDVEAPDIAFDSKILEEDYDVLDWPSYNAKNDTLNLLTNYVEALDGKICNVLKHIPVASLIIDNAYGLKPIGRMEKLIHSGIQFLNQYDKVYTTRLHGLILSILLDKEVVILDNSYGKSTTFYNTWLTDFNNVKLVQ